MDVTSFSKSRRDLYRYLQLLALRLVDYYPA
jgi:hypothetical protein